jgi:hypothetical protein
MRRRRIVIAAAVLLLAVIVGTVVAELLLTKSIPGSMVVKPAVSMGVYDVDGSTSLDQISYGQFQWGTTFNFPGHLAETPTQFYYTNNTDQVSFYVSFSVTNAPLSAWTVHIKRGDQASFTTLNFAYDGSESPIYQFPIESRLVNPDPATQYAVWYLTIYVGEPDFGTYTPTLQIHAYDSPSG